MKKLLALFLSLAAIFGLTACSEADSLLGELENAAGVLDQVLDQMEDTTVYELSPDPWETDSYDTAPYEDPAYDQDQTTTSSQAPTLDPNGWYYSAQDVGLYIYTYGDLPDNFITKAEARDLGWEGGSVEDYAPGYAIGGDRFGNYEGLLPEEPGRTYTECDIDTLGKDSRGAKRIVFSNDGLIYYTEDHYESFVLLYGEVDP